MFSRAGRCHPNPNQFRRSAVLLRRAWCALRRALHGSAVLLATWSGGVTKLAAGFVEHNQPAATIHTAREIKNPHAKHPKQRQPFVFSFSNFAHIIVPSAISSHPARQNKDRLDIHTNNETLLKFPDKIGKYSSKQQYVPVHFKTCVVQSGPAALRLLPGTSIEQTK